MKRLVLGAAIAGIFFICAIAEGSDWIFLRESAIGTAYYDRASIKRLLGSVIRVSVKYAYSSEGIKEFREAFPAVNVSETVSYTLYVYDVNCSADSFRLIKATTYNSAESAIRGTELDFGNTGQSAWEHITPHSVLEQLSEESCRWELYDR